MEFDKAKFMEKLKELVAYGKKKKSVLEYQEINDFFRDMPLDAEQMEKVFEYLEASGIDVLRLSDMTEDPNAADRDLLLLDDDDIDLSEEEEIDMENIDLSVPEGVSIEDPVRMYLKEIGKVPLLSAEEEIKLAQRMEEGDEEAKKRLAEANLRLVVSIAKRYLGRGMQFLDLIQEGNLGLMKAVKRFDPNMGVRLVSFAVHWIKAEIHEYVIRNWRIVKIATTKAQRKLFFNLRSLKKSSKKLTLEEARSIANDLNVTPEQVLEMEGRLTAYDAAFEAQGDDDDDTPHTAPALYLEDNRYDPARLIEEEDYEEQSTTALHEAMDQLDDRSRNILQRRWLDDDKSTLHELAAEYNVSAERIRQLEKNAMEKIKTAMSAS